ncbi:shikimate kinase [Listeria grandensis]|uniref:shikimate kinase n=1 Tax=Listeria grandensis TaxID=1494963 RepID=UPI00164CEF5C|nr:shikimate kinase [Listeria grandensis]MBC6314619.1 shikimate kinase [Listeria grandensis]
MNQVVLTGFMGAGKSTVGRILAENLALPLIDIDTEIQSKFQSSVTEIFARLGESVFRNEEHDMLMQVLQQEAVISTGGGIILSPQNRAKLQSADFVVYLKTSPDIFLKRLEGDTTRPLIQEKSPEEIKILFDSRTQLYEATSHLVIETDLLTPQEIAKKIKKEFQIRKEKS